MHERDKWIQVGQLSKNIYSELLDLKKQAKNLVSDETYRRIENALREINEFRNAAENEMFSKRIAELNIFYGQKDPDFTLNKFIKEIVLKNLKNERVSATILYNSYRDWCDFNNVKPITMTAFGIEMSKKFKKIKSNGIYYIIQGDLDA